MKGLILPCTVPALAAIAAQPLNSVLPARSLHLQQEALHPSARCFVAPSLAGLQPLSDGRFNYWFLDYGHLFPQMIFHLLHRASTKIKTPCWLCKVQLMNRSNQRAAVPGWLRNNVLPLRTSESRKNLTSSQIVLTDPVRKDTGFTVARHNLHD